MRNQGGSYELEKLARIDREKSVTTRKYQFVLVGQLEVGEK